MFKQLIAIVTVAVIIGGGASATAQIPADVLKPYNQYQDAIESGNYVKANRAALSAWRQSEDSLGDTKITGDLALNYAALGPKLTTNQDFEARSEAFTRAIELGQFHGNDATEAILSRHLQFLIYQHSTTVTDWSPAVKSLTLDDFGAMDTALAALDQQKSWYAAAMETLRTMMLVADENYPAAIKPGETALAIFTGLDAAEPSAEYYQLRLELGRAYYGAQDYLAAALSVQDNFTIVPDAAISNTIAYRSEIVWKRSWVALHRAGQLDAAYAKGLCECVEMRTALMRPIPIVQAGPILPARADRSGEVILLLDVRDDGSVENIRVAASTEKMFGRAAVAAAKDFVYTAVLDGGDPAQRRDIPVRFLFTLSDGKGDVSKPKPLKTILPITAHQDMISDNATLVASGYRIRVR